MLNRDNVKLIFNLSGRILVFSFSSLSIISLLLYFQGIFSFDDAVLWLLLPEFLGLAALGVWSHRTGRVDLLRRLLGGLWAGAVATLAYDVVRVPIYLNGIPVFKAISYFGTVFLGQETPTPFSEVLGWTYHLSNGLSFGLMYAAMVNRPGPISGVAWGLALEGAMLVTPYAEIFGYGRDVRFLSITIWAHVAYGLGLWWGLRSWLPERRPLSHAYAAFVLIGVPLGISAIAVDFNGRYAEHLAASPPPYIGKHLYTTWDVPEPDRVSALWIMKRFVDPEARFHFVPPFTAIRYGQPFDIPEAEIRRQGVSSATEILVSKQNLDTDEKIRRLSEMTHLAEVTPWLLPTDADAREMARALRRVTEEACGQALHPGCLDPPFNFLEAWYSSR